MKKPSESLYRSLVDACKCDVMIFVDQDIRDGSGWAFYRCAEVLRMFLNEIVVICGKCYVMDAMRAAKTLVSAGYKVAISDYEILI